MTNIYLEHETFLHRVIVNQLKKDIYFCLSYSDADFETATRTIHKRLLNIYPFLKDELNNMLDFIKDHHRYMNSPITAQIIIDQSVTTWVPGTLQQYNVNVIVFAEIYANWFYSNPDNWNTSDICINDTGLLEYNYKVNNNLFNIDLVYKEVSDKPFLTNKKDELEILIMHEWLFSLNGDPENYWFDYYNSKI